MFIIIDALELNHSHLHRRGAGKREEGRDWAEWEIERSNDLYSETLLFYVYFSKTKPLLGILWCLCFLNFILYWHIVYKW
jgi:hypothetical protein